MVATLLIQQFDLSLTKAQRECVCVVGSFDGLQRREGIDFLDILVALGIWDTGLSLCVCVCAPDIIF